MALTLIDAGPVIAYYNRGDDWHERIKLFLENFRGQFVTSEAVVEEVLYMLSSMREIQNLFLYDLSKQLYVVESMLPLDFAHIAMLNLRYASVPADYADLSLIALSERLNISDILSLDSDFDIYRRLRNKPFNRIFPTQ
jgi:predicted nucleic acid-binding protein